MPRNKYAFGKKFREDFEEEKEGEVERRPQSRFAKRKPLDDDLALLQKLKFGLLGAQYIPDIDSDKHIEYVLEDCDSDEEWHPKIRNEDDIFGLDDPLIVSQDPSSSGSDCYEIDLNDRLFCWRHHKYERREQRKQRRARKAKALREFIADPDGSKHFSVCSKVAANDDRYRERLPDDGSFARDDDEIESF